MKNFFKEHYEKILAVLAVALFVILAVYFVWGIRTLAVGFGKAIKVPEGKESVIRFDLEGAEGLNLR